MQHYGIISMQAEAEQKDSLLALLQAAPVLP